MINQAVIQTLVDFIGRQLATLMPHDKADWVAAMLAEANAIECPNEALGFTLGCLSTCIQERIREMEFQRKVIQSLMLIGLLGLGAIAAWSSIGVWRVHAPAGIVFVGLAVVYIASAMIAFFLGSRALAVTAGGMLGAAILLSAGLNANWASRAGLVNIQLFKALAIESIVIWGSIVAGSLYLLHLAKRDSRVVD
ncbi:hypothetical protein [Novosphingobium sp. AAP83]|uniref:hypothetical protein n=1 Tax=Novosphingobium sp. AAP83 TaxID=1523425 RepID=UPI0009EC5900|nr:hypothetical protein [Novosphingobium sp. AAP83]